MKMKYYLILLTVLFNITESSAVDILVKNPKGGKPIGSGTITQIVTDQGGGKPILRLSAEQFDQNQIIALECNVTEKVTSQFLGMSLKELFIFLSQTASSEVDGKQGVRVICEDDNMFYHETGSRKKLTLDTKKLEIIYSHSPSIKANAVNIGN
jgi:hypothetical protein